MDRPEEDFKDLTSELPSFGIGVDPRIEKDRLEQINELFMKTYRGKLVDKESSTFQMTRGMLCIFKNAAPNGASNPEERYGELDKRYEALDEKYQKQVEEE